MKKIIYLSAAIMLAAACHKAPSQLDKDGEYLVYTSRAEGTDFSAYKTYNIPDSLLIIGQSAKPEYSKSTYSLALIDQYKKMMNSYGYVYTDDKDAADLGIQVTYIIETENYVNYISDPYWWLDYPGYWHPGYWGQWTGWNYGYPVVYSFSTNSLITEIVDLTAEDGTGTPLPILWTSYIGGPKGGSIHSDVLKLKLAIGQSFSQSQYLDQSGR
ncbi:MAG: DUF4136 domain-containing protein [Bacteroidales bacterium]|nr:DUF4136 domain-containing protein [Bacteroidales bacterium]